MKSIITISREFGSGGREIGKKLSERLNIPFYDKELLEMASKQSGICEELFYRNDESHSNSLLYSLVMGTYPLSSDGKIHPNMPLNHKLFLAQFDTIKKIAEQGPCVIVGRCADKVRDFIRKTDKNRANYYNYYSDMKWGEASNYDLCINSSQIGIEGAVDLMVTYIGVREKYIDEQS